MKDVQLFAVQPRIAIGDYASAEAFTAKHRGLAEQVAARRDPDLPALAVWPEMVGTFLPLAGRADRVTGATTTEQAMRRIALPLLPRLLAAMARHRTAKLEEALLTVLAPDVHRIMYDTFSAIAREHDLWVVAGSALLPRNRHGDTVRAYAPADARTYNTSYTFDPSGALVGVTRKVNLVPTQEDVLHLSAAPPDELAATDTPFGRLGTLICYDGFREAHTADEPGWVPCGPVLDRLGVEIVAQPSANAWAWDAPWAFNEPGEDLLRREQWFAEGMPATLRGLSHVRYVVNPQLVGEVLDNHFEAPSLILARTGPDAVEVLAEASDPRGEEILAVRVTVHV